MRNLKYILTIVSLYTQLLTAQFDTLYPSQFEIGKRFLLMSQECDFNNISITSYQDATKCIILVNSRTLFIYNTTNWQIEKTIEGSFGSKISLNDQINVLASFKDNYISYTNLVTGVTYYLKLSFNDKYGEYIWLNDSTIAGIENNSNLIINLNNLKSSQVSNDSSYSLNDTIKSKILSGYKSSRTKITQGLTFADHNNLEKRIIAISSKSTFICPKNKYYIEHSTKMLNGKQHLLIHVTKFAKNNDTPWYQHKYSFRLEKSKIHIANQQLLHEAFINNRTIKAEVFAPYYNPINNNIVDIVPKTLAIIRILSANDTFFSASIYTKYNDIHIGDIIGNLKIPYDFIPYGHNEAKVSIIDLSNYLIPIEPYRDIKNTYIDFIRDIKYFQIYRDNHSYILKNDQNAGTNEQKLTQYIIDSILYSYPLRVQTNPENLKHSSMPVNVNVYISAVNNQNTTTVSISHPSENRNLMVFEFSSSNSHDFNSIDYQTKLRRHIWGELDAMSLFFFDNLQSGDFKNLNKDIFITTPYDNPRLYVGMNCQLIHKNGRKSNLFYELVQLDKVNKLALFKLVSSENIDWNNYGIYIEDYSLLSCQSQFK